MKRLTLVILTCLCALMPARARADDGGWLDWLWKWDPKFIGASVDFHLLCYDRSGHKIDGCEEWFRHIFDRNPVHRFARILKPKDGPITIEMLTGHAEIKHEIDFRIGYHENHGDRYDDSNTRGKIRVINPTGMYHYNIAEWVSVGAGGGYATVSGDRFKTFSRVLLVPANVQVYWKALAFRAEANYLMGGLTAADFGDTDPAIKFARSHEWNYSFAIGWDVRHIGTNATR